MFHGYLERIHVRWCQTFSVNGLLSSQMSWMIFCLVRGVDVSNYHCDCMYFQFSFSVHFVRGNDFVLCRDLSKVMTGRR